MLINFIFDNGDSFQIEADLNEKYSDVLKRVSDIEMPKLTNLRITHSTYKGTKISPDKTLIENGISPNNTDEPSIEILVHLGDTRRFVPFVKGTNYVYSKK